jgi:hypothetical protein
MVAHVIAGIVRTGRKCEPMVDQKLRDEGARAKLLSVPVVGPEIVTRHADLANARDDRLHSEERTPFGTLGVHFQQRDVLDPCSSQIRRTKRVAIFPKKSLPSGRSNRRINVFL